METFLFKALQLIVALIILVTIHEFGHYIFARIFGIKVNRFYLFFNPWFSLLKWRPDKGTLDVVAYDKEVDGKTVEHSWLHLKVSKPRPTPEGRSSWRDTLYGLGWLPLGGYCDIAGMVDETTSASELAAEPQAWEFRSKSAFKRFMVMVAGVMMNFILAIVIYAGIAFHWGDRVVPFTAATEGMDFSEEMQAAGFRNGDIILEVDGKAADAKSATVRWDLIQPGAEVKVLRDHRDTVGIKVPAELLTALADNDSPYMQMRVPVYVDKVVKGEGAYVGGMADGDRIVKVGNDTTPTLTEFYPAIRAAAGSEVPVTVIRDGRATPLTVNVSDAGKIGVQLRSPVNIFDIEEVHYSLLESLPRGWEIGTGQLATYVSSLSMVFTKEGAQSIGGFGALGSLFPEKWDWYSFWQITAFLSVILAFMNIIPIPGLDGGYILFLLIEMVTRRKVGNKVIEYANMVGMAFLLLLLLYANGNDIYRFLIR